MRRTQFIFLCETFGNPNLPIKEKWKCVKYIFVENPLVDVQRLIKRNEILYIDNENIGPGFYILGNTNSNLGISKREKVVTFIPLKLIDKISIVTSFDKNDDSGSDDNTGESIFVDTNGNVLIIDNMDVGTYEDIIIINNVDVDTNGDTLIINEQK